MAKRTPALVAQMRPTVYRAVPEPVDPDARLVAFLAEYPPEPDPPDAPSPTGLVYLVKRHRRSTLQEVLP